MNLRPFFPSAACIEPVGEMPVLLRAILREDLPRRNSGRLADNFARGYLAREKRPESFSRVDTVRDQWIESI